MTSMLPLISWANSGLGWSDPTKVGLGLSAGVGCSRRGYRGFPGGGTGWWHLNHPISVQIPAPVQCHYSQFTPKFTPNMNARKPSFPPYTRHGLSGGWSAPQGVSWATEPSRLEGEVANLPVYGSIPREIDGTFYRIMVDPFFPQEPENATPIEGDGNVCAFRIYNGQVDMKTKYVDTERLRLERRANRRLFGLYRNPYTHHPCVRAAVDSTANTNLVHWAGHLLALKEVALPYSVDPNTLDTITYDPFGKQVNAKTFTAHPKVDPFTNELVVFGYEAKGLASLDIVIYALDQGGNKRDEQWITAPWCAMIHDCAITPNFIILVLWPFEADLDRIKAGHQHWAFNPSRPVTFIVVPRRLGRNLPPGWKSGDHRVYQWENCLTLHTAGAWEESTSDGITLCMETSRVFGNELPWFPPADGVPTPQTSSTGKGDYVRWKLDLSQPSWSRVPDPMTVLNRPAEFARIDERFATQSYSILFLNVVLHGGKKPGVLPSLDALAMLNTRSGRTEYFDPGEDGHVEEPVFIPRGQEAGEGDGWVLAMVKRESVGKSDLVVLDTRNFSTPVAVVELPMKVQGQIHGNWVSSDTLGERKSLVRAVDDVVVSGRGALEIE